ncbi:MAG: DUF2250 domain-containing protein [Thermotogota bacterium]
MNENIGFLINNLSKNLKYILNKKIEGKNITSSQYSVLKYLQYNNPDYQKNIADHLNADRPTITEIIKKLEKKKFIKKIKDEKDKRYSKISIDETGLKIISEIDIISNNIIEKLLKNFSENEKELFKILLKKADENLWRLKNE